MLHKKLWILKGNFGGILTVYISLTKGDIEKINHELVPNGCTLNIVTLYILTLVNTAVVDLCYFNIAQTFISIIA